MITFVAFAVAVLLVVLLGSRQWYRLNSKDLGTMSRQWLEEHNAEHR